MAGKGVSQSDTIVNLFQDVPDNISIGLIPSKAWSDAEFDAMPHYQMIKLLDHELLKRANMLEQSLDDGICTNDIQYVILSLAMHLKDTDLNEAWLQQFWAPHDRERSKVMKDLTLILKDVPSTSQTPIGLRWASRAPAKSTEVLDKALGDVPAPSQDDPQDKTAEEKEKEKTMDINKLMGDNNLSQPDKEKIAFACFMSAYLFRLLTKTPVNIDSSWGAMLNRFTGFYGVTAPQFRKPSANWAASLKARFTADHIIGKTWLKTFVNAETDTSVEMRSGMIRYLACMPLSYAGMHAYKLFLEVRHLSRQENKWLLGEMCAVETKEGLMEIANILIKFAQRDNGPTVSPKYKYARLVGPEFFQSLQTKQCNALVYLLVSITKEYKKSTGQDHSDPEKIVGIETMSEDLKAKLKAGAKNIVQNGPIANVKLYSKSMASAMLPPANAPTPPEAPPVPVASGLRFTPAK